MRQQEQAYPVEFVGHRKARVVALTQKLDDGSEKTIVLTIDQLERLARRARDEISGVRA